MHIRNEPEALQNKIILKALLLIYYPETLSVSENQGNTTTDQIYIKKLECFGGLYR